MKLYSIPSLPVHRWVIGKGVLFALLGLLALDGGLCASNAFALQLGSFPSNMAFSGTVGGSNPAAQSFTITNSGGGTLSWTISSSATWLHLNTVSGTTTTETDTISVSVTTSGMTAGTYNGFIAVTAPASPDSPRYFPVSLTLTAATVAPTIGLSPVSLGFSGTAGGANPAAKTFSVTNTGGGTLAWAASDNAAWLTLSPPSGTNSGTVTANVNLTGLAAGTYNATVSVAATGATTTTMPVTLTVSPAAPTTSFSLAPATLAYTATVGSPNQANGVTITNTGSSTLTATWNDNISWLVATSGDTVTLAPGARATITHTASMVGLAAGTYSGTATISGGGITKQVPVTLTLTAATSTPTIGLSPVSLGFSGTAGGANPAAKTFSVTNTGGGTLAWAASDNAAWLTLSPPSGTNSGTVTANVNLTGLAAGTYNAIITVTASGSTNSPVQIPVSLTLSTTTTNAASLIWNANTDTNLAGYNVYQATSSGAYTTPVATVPKPATSYTVTGLKTGTTYFFVITAYNSAGVESLLSNEVSKSIY